MSDSPYDGLLRDFQAAFVRYGEELFVLSAYTDDEKNAAAGLDEVESYLGFVPLGEYRPEGTLGYAIYATIVRIRWGRAAGRWEEPYDCFRDLAARAGAFLPEAARLTVRFAPAEPVSWWLAYMWWQNPPDAETLAAPDGITKARRVIWAQPFLESAQRVEHLLCCATSPKEDEDKKAVMPFSLRDIDRHVLRKLKQRPTTLHHNTKLETDDYPERTIADSVSRLIDAGFVERPEGPRSGCQISVKGMSVPLDNGD